MGLDHLDALDHDTLGSAQNSLTIKHKPNEDTDNKTSVENNKGTPTLEKPRHNRKLARKSYQAPSQLEEERKGEGKGRS